MEQARSPQASFNSIIQGNLDDLIDLQYSSAGWPPMLRHYLELVIAYHQGDVERIQRITAAVPGEFAALRCLGVLRQQIRLRELDPALLRSAEELAKTSPLAGGCDWSGELLIVCGMGHEIRGADRESLRCYREAAAALTATGADKKALRARMNAVVAETRLDPNQRIISDYLDIFRQARERGELALAGQALLNVAWEMQLVAAFSVALKFCTESIALFSGHMGSRDHDLAVLQRCLLFLQMGRAREALLDFESTNRSRYKEIVAVRSALRGALQAGKRPRRGRDEKQLFEALSAQWREKMRFLARKDLQPLSELENQIVYELCSEPRTARELASLLYGDRLAPEVTLKRFENVLGGLRKKQPDLIVLHDGKYRLVERQQPISRAA